MLLIQDLNGCLILLVLLGNYRELELGENGVFEEFIFEKKNFSIFFKFFFSFFSDFFFQNLNENLILAFSSSKTECENAGFCWTEYSIDTIVQEAFGGRSKENYKSLFMFTPQIDRILGDDDLSLFDSKCVKKASDNYVNMVRFEQLRS